ncbi:hypothetical protein BH23THE1_BH23THE1_31460 [soil metagenome]
MNDILLNISKASIRSIFTAKKYDDKILGEDLHRILYIRNLLEEIIEFIKMFNSRYEKQKIVCKQIYQYHFHHKTNRR